MAVALDLGGTPVAVGELQAAVEDYTVSQSAEFDVEHDHRGRHTKPFESLEVSGPSQFLGGSVLGLILAFEEGYETELTANTNDLTQPDGSPIEDVVIRLSSTGDVNLTGIVPADQTKRQVHLLEHGGAGTTITLMHNTTSTYRFALPSEMDVELASGEVVLIQWDPNSAIWRMVRGGGQTSMINGVQRGTITLAGSVASDTATISAVDTTKASVRMLGALYTSGGTPTQPWMPGVRLVLTNSTTVTAIRPTGTGHVGETETIVVGFEVLEYR